ALHDHARRPRLEATGIARVPVVDLVSILLAGEHGLLGVHNDNVVAHVDVRRIGRLVLALEARGNDRRQAADYEAFGVDQDPLLFHLAGLGDVGFHLEAPGTPELQALQLPPTPFGALIGGCATLVN